MEWLLYGFGYIVLSICVGIVTTKFTYKESLANNRNPIPQNRYSGRRTQEEIDELETKRRKKLASEAMTAGFWVGLFWIITLPIMILLLAFGFILKMFFVTAIKPADRDFVSDKQLRKAQAIIAKHERETRQQFDRELGIND